MSQIESNRGRRSAGFGLVTAVGGAFAAAMFSMGTANAAPVVIVDPQTAPDPYVALFGAGPEQLAGNTTLDTNADLASPTNYTIFDNDVSAFEASPFEHGLEQLVNAIDPSAFYEQTGGLIAGDVGTLAGGAYLVPDDALGYLATSLDYGLLTPTGLDYILTPLIDVLLGSSPGI
jgi:hypothetical protein